MLAVTAANAADYALSYSTAAGSFSGVLSLADTANADGFYLITGLTGDHDGDAASLIAPGGFPLATSTNNNLFKPTPEYLDVFGFSYNADGFAYNVYYNAGSYLECSDSADACDNEGRYYAISNLTVSAVTAAVPEPATWGMMLLGFGLVGAAARRRRTAGTVAA